MTQTERTDFLIIGAGIAGLRAAVELADQGQVMIVTKESLSESNTHYAQGGIAVALSGDEDVALHLEDTLAAGDGLVYRPAAEALVREGPLRVEELIEWGTQFDRSKADGAGELGKLMMGREAAHSLPRILHANGDATGAEISRSLLALARQHRNITFADWTTVIHLEVAEGKVVAADLLSQDQVAEPYVRRVSARAILLASGGAGQVFSDTTNPAVATGDGIALALQAGAQLADMEFYQFHPTALAMPGLPRFLISEAVRGEGAWLINHKGERFMERYHPQLELAPRDVVARAIAREGIAPGGEALPVYLDLRHIPSPEAGGIDLVKRFPGISRFVAQHGLMLHRDLIPVRPAAHYLMGGVRTDLDGRTTLPGLYAAGEVACTGVHGANRLASNSLLEGLVFGARAAKVILADDQPQPELQDVAPQVESPAGGLEPKLVSAVVTKLREAMFRCAGLLRERASLQEGMEIVESVTQALAPAPGEQPRRDLFEARAMATVAQAILVSALARTESRGAHFRNDYAKRDDQDFHKHSVLAGGVVDFGVLVRGRLNLVPMATIELWIGAGMSNSKIIRETQSRKLHIIPRFYFEDFTNRKGPFFVFEKGRDVRNSGPGRECAERDFFEFEIGEMATRFRVDKHLERFETKASPIHQKLLRDVRLDANEQTVWALFVASLFLRSRRIRSELSVNVTDGVWPNGLTLITCVPFNCKF